MTPVVCESSVKPFAFFLFDFFMDGFVIVKKIEESIRFDLIDGNRRIFSKCFSLSSGYVEYERDPASSSRHSSGQI